MRASSLSTGSISTHQLHMIKSRLAYNDSEKHDTKVGH